jgi:hypothetical protein
MDLNSLTPAEFKKFFCDDFPNLNDSAVLRAFMEARVNFNQSIWGDEDSIKLGYFYLTAHYICMDQRNAAGGSAATGSFPVSSRTVGSVSESYDIPQAYKDNAAFSYLTGSGYGMKYLSMLLPNLVGNIGVVCGATRP